MIEGRNWIAGEWRESAGAIEDRNPSDLADLVGNFAQAGPEAGIWPLPRARTQPKWAAAGLETRAASLDAVGRELMARLKELGALLSREEGKTLPEGVGEVYRAGQFFAYFAGEAVRNLGSSADLFGRRGSTGRARAARNGRGDSPGNFPMVIAAWKIAPALAFGNAVIWKPANSTPASAWGLTEIISRQPMPKGLFNLVMGPGSTIGSELIAKADIQGAASPALAK